ncbi:MAG: IclR family transcriptional regulator C-terminal domain-containing protein [Paraburkholderia sp.]|uniref:IclR family transcriptional regulator n=1 Tax=Burkholderiaceae TaxID=119060 RepID=UPI0010F4A1FE|nr:IclR family transcriptional regulator C-terminal domain-containing protein [Burkholderia sp. 4M9327F10]
MRSRTVSASVRSPDDSKDLDNAGSRTLRRGLDVLEAVLGASGEGVRIIDLCRRCGLERATVYRILETLIHEGYVEPSGRFRYVAGKKVERWRDERMLSQSGIAARLEPVLRQVSAMSGDAAFAVVREGCLSSCIARQVGTYPIQILAVQVGTRQPLGVGAGGLALLAALPVEEIEAIIAQLDGALSSYGGMDAERLRLLTNATRERGWSVIGNHAAKGALAVGVAVRDRQGRPVAAVSVAAPIERMVRQRQESIAGEIKAALTTFLGEGL